MSLNLNLNLSQNLSQNPKERSAQFAEMRPRLAPQSALFAAILSDWTPTASTEAFILFSLDEDTWRKHREGMLNQRQCHQ